MAEGARSHSFGHRLIGSARGLACSTFSGVAGIEAELKDPLATLSGGGKRDAGPQTLGRTPRDISTAKASSTKDIQLGHHRFRSMNSRATNDIQQRHFDLFANPKTTYSTDTITQFCWGRSDSAAKPYWRLKDDEPWTSEESAQGWRLDHGNVLDSYFYGILRSHPQGIVWLDADELYEWELSRTAPCEGEARSVLPDVRGTSMLDRRHEVEQDAWRNGFHTIALERLNQIERHFARSHNLSTEQKDVEALYSSEPISLLSHDDTTQLKDLRPDVHVNQLQYVHNHKSLIAQSHQHDLPQTYYSDQAEQYCRGGEASRTVESSKVECHQRLEHETKSLSRSLDLRVCSHRGCLFESFSFEDWWQHYTEAHYEGSNEASRGSCARCIDYEDTH